jgi:hypothetical protein
MMKNEKGEDHPVIWLGHHAECCVKTSRGETSEERRRVQDQQNRKKWFRYAGSDEEKRSSRPFYYTRV